MRCGIKFGLVILIFLRAAFAFSSETESSLGGSYRNFLKELMAKQKADEGSVVYQFSCRTFIDRFCSGSKISSVSSDNKVFLERVNAHASVYYRDLVRNLIANHKIKEEGSVVYSLGCGVFFESLCLIDLKFSKLIGIDKNRRLISNASCSAGSSCELKLICADLLELDYKDYEKADLILFRHPGYLFKEGEDSYKSWGKIIARAYSYLLKHKGFMIITMYTEVEMNWVLSFFKEFMTVVPKYSGKNNRSVGVRVPRKAILFYDKYVVVVQRLSKEDEQTALSNELD